MLRIDHENWIKAGVEYVDGKQNVSAVVTHRTSDWSVVQLPDAPRSLWIKAVRRLDAVEIFFSRDDKEYTMIRTCWLQDNCPVMVGLMGACPDGKGFTATFEEFKVTPLADQRRLEWAKNKPTNKERQFFQQAPLDGGAKMMVHNHTSRTVLLSQSIAIHSEQLPFREMYG